MIEETGQVIEIRGNYAWVESERSSTCGSCAVRQGCGTSAIARVLGPRRVRLRVLNRIHARVGEEVVVGITETGLLRGSLAVYLVPLLGLLLGAGAGQWLAASVMGADTDVPAVAGAVTGFLLALAWLRRFSRDRETDANYQPVTLRRQITITPP